MRKRTRSRELALQVLYQIDITQDPPEKALEIFWRDFPTEPPVKEFAESLVLKTIEHLEKLDALISRVASNWEIKRMARVDRNVLRLGACELLWMEDIPPKVSINEAVELAKKFGDVESGKFINGILDKIHKERLPQVTTP